MSRKKEKERFQKLYADLLRNKQVKNRADLAYRLGVSPQSLSKVLTDGSTSRPPTHEHMKKAIEVFNLPADYFLAEKEVPYNVADAIKQDENPLQETVDILKQTIEDKKMIIELLQKKINDLEKKA